MKRKLNLRIFEKPVEIDEPVFLMLKQYHDEIRVVAVRSNGSEYPAPFIVSFHSNGTLERMASLNATLGFKLDTIGRIKDSDIDEDEAR